MWREQCEHNNPNFYETQSQRSAYSQSYIFSREMLTNEDYLSFLSLFNPVFFCTSVILQTIWLLFIIFHSAKMGIFRFIIAHTSVCNIACLCLVVLFQFRQVSSNVPVEVRSYGPLRILSTLTMYTCHQIFQLTILLSGISLIVTLYFKLMTLRWTKVSSITMILTFLAFHIPFFLSTVSVRIVHA